MRGRGTARRAVALLLILLIGCSSAGTVERVPIPPGSTLRSIADSLASHRVIRSRNWFRLRARLAHIDRDAKAGIYEFPRGTSIATVLRALKSGSALQFRITLPVGGTLFDLARNAQERLSIPRESILVAARDSALLRRLGVPGPSAEGWLLPESFDFGGFDRASEVIARFVSAREHGWDATWDARAKSAGLDRATLLTLASIVEAEAKLPDDRPLIAAVYRNRLRLGMPLQADPTIEYAYLLENGERKGRLYTVDYQLDSPWNTYRRQGLPPGPIGNPSREAIESVLSPASVPYLYFVAGPDGRSVFATTYSEHLRNIRNARPGR